MIRRKIETDLYTLHADCCLSVMPTLADGSVDLIVADPPYNGVKDADWDNQWKTDADYLAWMGSVLDKFRRVLKPNGSLYLFASPQMAWGVEGEVRRRLTVLSRVTWLKTNAPGFDGWKGKMEKEALRQWYPHSEQIIFAEQQMREARYDEAARVFHQKVYAPIGAHIRSKRKAAGLTMNELTELIGEYGKVNHGGAVSNWESGSSIPSEEQYVKICLACGGLRRDCNEARERMHEDIEEMRLLRREYEDQRPIY